MSPAVEDAIVAYAITHPTHGPRRIADSLRLERFGGFRVAHGTVSNVLRRYGPGRRSMRLAAAELRGLEEGGPISERALRELRARERRQTLQLGCDTPGEELFLDAMYVGKLKGVGPIWQFAAIDGACSFAIAYAEALADAKAATVTGFLERALDFFSSHGIEAKRLMSDNAWSYTLNRSLRELLAHRGIRRLTIRPRRPRTNGKAERFIQTLEREWAYALTSASSEHRRQALPYWLDHHNGNRPHSSRRPTPDQPRSERL